MPANAVILSEIASADWSLALDANGGLGNVVEGLDDVNQCIGIILTTPPGSDPFRPDFACDIFQFIDRPVTLALPAIVREAVAAITKWEPRVQLLSVAVEPVTAEDQGGGHLTVTTTWRLKLAPGAPAPAPRTTTVRIGA